MSTPLSSLWAASGGDKAPKSTAGTFDKVNDIPPRLQWTANFGYCGEVSFISAGLYYGQYVSQYDARSIASKKSDQSKEGSQLLLGVNDAYAASQMHLNAVQWKSTSTVDPKNFLAWVKENVASGYPVIISVFENRHSFDGSNDENAGDAEYDHIVQVTGISSKHPLSKPSVYDADDVMTLSDNGLWSPTGQPAYVYHYTSGAFLANRKEANSETHLIYSLPREGRNYGVVITGIIDHDGKTLPVRLSTDRKFEKPAMREGSNTRPQAEDLTLAVTVSGLRPGLSYKLYRYNSFQAVPDSGFNANAAKADKIWAINIQAGSTYIVKEKIRSDEIAVYRAVPDTAP
ncbi:C39 family peptidase [Rhizobium sp. BR 314]|uniref:C39 family peptidase n=1 Tax=Rhizobium sp. BR 314 TaxID=3040013 RepID=UPI0039BEEFE1